MKRREVIKLLAVAGLGVYLPGCTNDSNTKTGSLLADSTSDTAKQIEEELNNNNVVYLTKTDEEYHQLKVGFNLRYNKQPAVIALCKNTQGVAEAMRYAKKQNLKVAVKSGGHSLEGFSSNDGGLVINLSLLNTVKVNADNTVTVGPGCLLRELYDSLLPQGLVVPAGSCGTVGLGGLALGGGYGFFAREHGLTCDNMISATMVDGEGNERATQEGERLMWALRGGGNGNFGVVTEMVFKTYTAPAHFKSHRVKAYKLTKDKAKLLLEQWFKHAVSLPHTCYSAFVLNGKTLTILVTNYGKDTGEVINMIEELGSIGDKKSFGKPQPLAKAAN